MAGRADTARSRRTSRIRSNTPAATAGSSHSTIGWGQRVGSHPAQRLLVSAADFPMAAVGVSRRRAPARIRRDRLQRAVRADITRSPCRIDRHTLHQATEPISVTTCCLRRKAVPDTRLKPVKKRPIERHAYPPAPDVRIMCRYQHVKRRYRPSMGKIGIEWVECSASEHAAVVLVNPAGKGHEADTQTDETNPVADGQAEEDQGR